jgi:hypothetical protein
MITRKVWIQGEPLARIEATLARPRDSRIRFTSEEELRRICERVVVPFQLRGV